MIDEPERRREIARVAARTCFETLFIARQPRSGQGRAQPARPRRRRPAAAAGRGRPRTSWRRCARCSSATASLSRGLSDRHPARPPARRARRDRQEHDGRRVRRPHRRGRHRPDVPDPRAARDRPRAARLQPTCASAPSDIEAIVLTHGHEDHVGALPWVLRELGRDRAPDLRRPADGRDGALEARRAQAQGRRRSTTCEPGETFDAGPFDLELVHVSHSIPDACAVALTCELGTMLVTGDYKFDQTPVDGVPDRRGAARRARPRGGAAAVRRLDQRRPRRARRRRRRASGRCSRRSSRAATGRIVVTSLRVERPPRPAGDRRRRRARPQGRAGRPLDAQEPQHRRAASATSRCPRGCWCRPRRSRTSPTTSWS